MLTTATPAKILSDVPVQNSPPPHAPSRSEIADITPRARAHTRSISMAELNAAWAPTLRPPHYEDFNTENTERRGEIWVRAFSARRARK